MSGNAALVDVGARRVTARSSAGIDAIADLAAALRSEGIEVEDLGLHQPSLDDVFLTLTGKPADPTSTDEQALIEETIR